MKISRILGSVPIAMTTAGLIQVSMEVWIMAELFWLNDTQWSAIAPLLPKLDTRIYPCGFSGWLDLNLDTALLAV